MTTVVSINALGVTEPQSNLFGFSVLIFGLSSGILVSLVLGVAMSVLTGVVCFIRGKRKVKTDISMEEATDGSTLISMKSLRGTNPFVKETTFTSFRAADTSCKEVELEEDERDQASDSAEKQQFLVKPHRSPIACSNENMHTAVSNPMYHSFEEFSDLEDETNKSESER